MFNNKVFVKFIHFLMYLALFIVIAAIILLIGFILLEGISNLHLDLLANTTPMIIATLLVVTIALIIAIPLGIFAAIYLQMYAKQGRLLSALRFSIDSLTGIPSIIYGLFALTFFVYYLGINRSIFTASLSMSIVVLPLIIKNTEEAIKTISRSQIEASLALGVSKFETITKIVIPFCLDGIINGVILAIGRIVGETAAILFVIGSVSRMPGSIMDPSSTLATHLYLILQEPTYAKGGSDEAYTIALILLIIIVILNIMVKIINILFKKKRGY